LVAAHNYDLEAATALGLKAAFATRPKEFGPGGGAELTPSQNWDFVTADFNELADQLEC
jgi:2-haloacid dehalogenase